MGILFGFPLFATAVRWRWHIDLPFPTLPIGSLPLAISNITWILVAMLFVLAAQLVVERTEYDLAPHGILGHRANHARCVPQKPFLRSETGSPGCIVGKKRK